MPGELEIFDISARHLTASDHTGTVTRRMGRRANSDPYCVFQLGRAEVKTKVVKKDLNPVWEDVLHLEVCSDKDQLCVRVFDWDRLTKDDPLGLFYWDLPHGDREGTVVGRLLEQRGQKLPAFGEIKFSYKYVASGSQRRLGPDGIAPPTSARSTSEATPRGSGGGGGGLGGLDSYQLVIAGVALLWFLWFCC